MAGRMSVNVLVTGEDHPQRGEIVQIFRQGVYDTNPITNLYLIRVSLPAKQSTHSKSLRQIRIFLERHNRLEGDLHREKEFRIRFSLLNSAARASLASTSRDCDLSSTQFFAALGQRTPINSDRSQDTYVNISEADL